MNDAESRATGCLVSLLRLRAERGGAGKMVIHFDAQGRIRKVEEAASFDFSEGRDK
ncbi:hypothetical protein R80B4_00965 [Fibrobacteres bacterium R8-0-B4]